MLPGVMSKSRSYCAMAWSGEPTTTPPMSKITARRDGIATPCRADRGVAIGSSLPQGEDMRALVLAVLVSLVAPAARAVDRTGMPELIRLTGHVGDVRPGESGTTNLTLNVDGGDTTFQLRQLDVVTGNRSASEVLSQITPVKPSLYLRAPSSVLKPIGEATPADTLVIQGFLRRDGGRNMQVSEVKMTPPPH
jgi:hypothetical protein